MRNFVGVIKDISENYFVPISIRGKRNGPKLEDRYTDAGAFFSVSGFTSDAQHFAWAHGIYLISFGMNTIFRPIIDEARVLIDRYVTKEDKKADVVRRAQQHLNDNGSLSREINKVFAYVGILDEIYLVLITADERFDFDPNHPDRFEAVPGGPPEEAIKEYRREKPDNVNFRFHFQNTNFEFTLPSSTSRHLIDAIETTYRERPFGFIDLPIELKTDNGNFRRIFRLDLSLPRYRTILNTLKG